MKDKLHSHIEELRSKYGLSILTVENSNWESGNGTSVTACSQHLTGPFFLLMCDHLFEPKILEDLITADYGAGVCQLAVDRNIDKPSELKEATLVQIDEKDIRAIGKGIENQKQNEGKKG
jgi:choline kinase